MIKYIPELSDVVFEEIPDRVSLAVEITNCRGTCPGCHSPFLKLDIGKELTPQDIDNLIEENFGVNCFLFMGEGNDLQALLSLCAYLKERYPRLERALYSGREEIEKELFAAFDYVKLGPYVQKLGPLNERTTNQRLYYHGKDISERFWHKKD